MKEKRYPCWEWIFAAAMWVAFCFPLLWMHYKAYDTLLLANDISAFWWITILVPAYPLSRWLLQGGTPHTPPDRNSIIVRLYTLFWCLIPASCFYALLTEPYRLAAWLLAAWIALFVPLYVCQRHQGPAAVGMLFLVGLAVTVGFLLIVQPVSAARAEQMVQKAGYTGLYRFDCMEFYQSVHFESTLANGEVIRCTMPAQRDPIGYYGFYAVKDSESYCVVVSAARGQIEVEEPQV